MQSNLRCQDAEAPSLLHPSWTSPDPDSAQTQLSTLEVMLPRIQDRLLVVLEQPAAAVAVANVAAPQATVLLVVQALDLLPTRRRSHHSLLRPTLLPLG